MPIGRGSFTPLLNPDIYRVFVETGKERPLEYTMVFNVSDMPWNPVLDRQISGLGTLPSKAEGGQFPLDEPIFGGSKEYEAEAFGLALEFTWEMWRDELYGVMREMVAELKRASNHRQEVQAWSVFNNAFSNSFPGFDGVALCSTAHVGLDGQTRANRPSPDIGFSITAIQNMILRFENMTNERGLPRLMAPTKFLLSPTNKFVAREILSSSGKPYTTDNELNPLLDEDMAWMICHYFPAAQAQQWFAITSKEAHDVNFMWRDHPILDSFDDPWSKNAIYTLYQRHTQGFSSYRGVDGSTG